MLGSTTAARKASVRALPTVSRHPSTWLLTDCGELEICRQACSDEGSGLVLTIRGGNRTTSAKLWLNNRKREEAKAAGRDGASSEPDGGSVSSSTTARVRAANSAQCWSFVSISTHLELDGTGGSAIASDRSSSAGQLTPMRLRPPPPCAAATVSLYAARRAVCSVAGPNPELAPPRDGSNGGGAVRAYDQEAGCGCFK